MASPLPELCEPPPRTHHERAVASQRMSPHRIDPHQPDASRQPLRPGVYQLIAVLGDVGAPTANLVSAPTSITVRR